MARRAAGTPRHSPSWARAGKRGTPGVALPAGPCLEAVLIQKYKNATKKKTYARTCARDGGGGVTPGRHARPPSPARPSKPRTVSLARASREAAVAGATRAAAGSGRRRRRPFGCSAPPLRQPRRGHPDADGGCGGGAPGVRRRRAARGLPWRDGATDRGCRPPSGCPPPQRVDPALARVTPRPFFFFVCFLARRRGGRHGWRWVAADRLCRGRAGRRVDSPPPLPPRSALRFS